MIVVLLTWQAAPARGDEGAAALEWSVPEACGTQDGFLTRLAALLGRPKSSLAREITTVSIDIAQRGEEWQLHVRRKQDGALIERDLAGRDCVALVEAAAIIVALWIDPRRAMPTSPPPDETRPGPAADPAPDPAVSLDQPMAPSNDFRETEPSSPSLGISAGVAGSAGTLPHPSIGARLSGWIERGSFRLELAVAWHPPLRGPRRGLLR